MGLTKKTPKGVKNCIYVMDYLSEDGSPDLCRDVSKSTD